MSDSMSAIKKDAVILRLLSTMPSHVQHSFTEEQLAYLKLALGSRHWEEHSVDLRGTFKPWRTRYYYVLLLGRNYRDASRWQKQLSGLMTTLLFSLFVVFSVMFGLLILYLIKSALGINLFKGFSLGIWDWFKGFFH